MSTHYDTLGLEPTASADDIKRAYRAFSRRHHPDIAGPDSAPLFAEGTTAYTILSDPQQRAAYDHELANPTPEPEPDIPLDDWGQDEAWEQEAPWGDEGDVVDAPIVDTPEPATPHTTPPTTDTPTPQAAADAPQRAVERDEVRVVDDLPHPALTALTGLAASAATIWWPTNPTAPRVSASVAAATVVIMLAAMWWLALEAKKKPATRERRPRTLFTRTVTAAAVITAAAAATIVALTVTHHDERLWWLAPIPAVIAATLITASTITTLRARHAVFSKRTLTDYIVFGNPPPGEVPALLNRALMPFVHTRADVRTIQQPGPARYFSHVLICGEKAVFLKAIGTGPGRYFWSGTSLLRDDGTNLVTALIGDYAAAKDRIVSDFKTRGLEASAYVVVLKNFHDRSKATTNTVSSTEPDVIDIDDLHATLARELPPNALLSRHAVVEALHEYARFGDVKAHV